MLCCLVLLLLLHAECAPSMSKGWESWQHSVLQGLHARLCKVLHCSYHCKHNAADATLTWLDWGPHRMLDFKSMRHSLDTHDPCTGPQLERNRKSLVIVSYPKRHPLQIAMSASAIPT
jgi:hypothetical protein